MNRVTATSRRCSYPSPRLIVSLPADFITEAVMEQVHELVEESESVSTADQVEEDSESSSDSESESVVEDQSLVGERSELERLLANSDPVEAEDDDEFEEKLDFLVPIEVEIPQDAEIIEAGTVLYLMDQGAVVRPPKDSPCLNLDVILLWREKSLFGKILDVFGPVQEPFYFVQLPEEVFQQLSLGTGLRSVVYSVKDETAFILPSQLRQEVHDDGDDDEMFFSDDEKENEFLEKTGKKKRSNKAQKPRPPPDAFDGARAAPTPPGVPAPGVYPYPQGYPPAEASVMRYPLPGSFGYPPPMPSSTYVSAAGYAYPHFPMPPAPYLYAGGYPPRAREYSSAESKSAVPTPPNPMKGEPGSGPSPSPVNPFVFNYDWQPQPLTGALPPQAFHHARTGYFHPGAAPADHYSHSSQLYFGSSPRGGTSSMPLRPPHHQRRW